MKTILSTLFILLAFVQDAVGARCGVGYYKQSGNCYQCAPGSFSASQNAAVCTPCVANQVQPFAGQASCITCPSGQYQNGDRTFCIQATTIPTPTIPAPTPTLLPTITPTSTFTGTPTSTPASTPITVPTCALMNTATPTMTPTGTPAAVNTSPGISTPGWFSVSGDLDDDFFPDVAFAIGGAAEVVLNIRTSPTKLVIGHGVLVADVGRSPGAQGYSLITAKLVDEWYAWNTTDVATEAVTRFAQTVRLGEPVGGCYLDDTYSPAMFVKSASAPALVIIRPTSNVSMLLPAGTRSVLCGPPEDGASSIFYLVKSARRKTVTVGVKKLYQSVLSSPRLAPRLKEIRLGTVPRAVGKMPAPIVLARLGTQQVLRVLSRSNRWRPIRVPKLPEGSAFSGLAGVHQDGASYIVLQVTTGYRAIRYMKVEVPRTLL